MYVKLPEPLLSDVTMAFIRPLVKVISSAVLPVLSLKKWIRDTECSYYFALMLQMTFSVLLSYREIPFIMMQSTQSDVGVFTAIWTGWGLS